MGNAVQAEAVYHMRIWCLDKSMNPCLFTIQSETTHEWTHIVHYVGLLTVSRLSLLIFENTAFESIVY